MSKFRIITIMAISIVLIVVAFLGGMYIASLTDKTPEIAPKTTTREVTKPEVVFNDTVYDLYEDVNVVRAENSTPALKMNPLLNQSAQAKCNDMVTRNCWSHNAPDGSEPWVFIKQQVGNYYALAENLAYGYTNSDQVVTGWLNSEGHKRNMLDSTYDEVGYAICKSPNYVGEGENIIVVQHLAKL